MDEWFLKALILHVSLLWIRGATLTPWTNPPATNRPASPTPSQATAYVTPWTTTPTTNRAASPTPSPATATLTPWTNPPTTNRPAAPTPSQATVNVTPSINPPTTNRPASATPSPVQATLTPWISPPTRNPPASPTPSPATATLTPSTNLPTTNSSASPTPSQAPGCGEVVKNVLKSPGYPGYYRNNMDCDYRVKIPQGLAMKISFSNFSLETHPSCRYDYLRISNDNNYTVGTYCGVQSGLNISFTGRYAVLTFHSDGSVTRRGYKLDFSFVSPDKPKITIPVVQAVQGRKLQCSAEGTRPINMSLIQNSTSLGQGTDTVVVNVTKEGNVTCMATNQAGTDSKTFSVTATLTPWTNAPNTNRPASPTPSQATGCGAVVNNTLKSPGYPNNYRNSMSCTYRVDIPHGMAMKIYFSHFQVFDLISSSFCWDKTIELVFGVYIT